MRCWMISNKRIIFITEKLLIGKNMDFFFTVFYHIVADAYTFREFKKYFYVLTYFLTLKSSYV